MSEQQNPADQPNNAGLGKHQEILIVNLVKVPNVDTGCVGVNDRSKSIAADTEDWMACSHLQRNLIQRQSAHDCSVVHLAADQSGAEDWIQES